MNRALVCAMCAGLLVMFDAAGASAAKAKTSKKAQSPEADSMQCREVTITGVVEEKESKPDAAGKVLKYFAIIDSKKNEWRPSAWGGSDANIKEYVGLKVKAICMQQGGGGAPRSVNYLAAIKSIEALDKAAFEAKKAEREEAKKAAAEAKAAAAEAAKKK